MTKVEQALHELRLDMARRIVAYAKSGSTDRAPSVVHFDVATYVNSQQYAREYQKLFRETPLLACLSTDISEPGSYQIFDGTGIPIVVVREGR